MIAVALMIVSFIMAILLILFILVEIFTDMSVAKAKMILYPIICGAPFFLAAYFYWRWTH